MDLYGFVSRLLLLAVLLAACLFGVERSTMPEQPEALHRPVHKTMGGDSPPILFTLTGEGSRLCSGKS